MSKYFNDGVGLLVDSTDGVPSGDEITELSDLEYAIMSIRMKYHFADILQALEDMDFLYGKVMGVE